MWGYNYGYPMMGYGYGYGALSWVHIAFTVVFALFVAAIVIAAIRFLQHGKTPWLHQGGNTAMNILKERYAKGEISKDEFEEKKKVLSA